ncbi:MAG: helix-turn-helix domain-containing protein [Lachnospiraceae bacterium]|nr:helix-turn-helix domain-containing protein [Lachnospiraceae bacterium]
MDISKKLREIREEKNLSVDDLAQKTGKDASVINGWESGEVVPSASDLIGLSKVYQMTMDEMLYNDSSAPEYNAEQGSYGKNSGSSTGSNGNSRKHGFTMGERITILIFPFLCVLVFLVLGITMGLWNPGWIVFTIIPVYYVLVIILRNVGNDAEEAVENYMDEAEKK